MKIALAVAVAACLQVCFAQWSPGSAEGYGPRPHENNPHGEGYGPRPHENNPHGEGYEPRPHENKRHGYEVKTTYHQKEYKAKKQCYQCAYSPPKTYYDQKVVVEKHQYGHEYDNGQYGQASHGPHGYGNDRRGHYGGYVKKTYVPVPYKVAGGWDKCMGPFSHYQAKDFGVDVWDCDSNCYTRKDKSGDIFRGCYKGEHGVNPNLYGCNYQAGATWCFCEGEKCNNGPAPGY